MKYVAIAGTDGWNATWVREGSDFAQMMAREGFEPVRVGARAYRWDGALDGVLGDNRHWEAFADSLYWFLGQVPFEDRNLIAHSHGGNIALLMVARGELPIRSLTTVGTPVRHDIPITEAEDYIWWHQHIYDTCFDVFGWLGQLGDGEVHLSRAFADARVHNISIKGIRHTKVLTDVAYLGLWRERGWLENIRTAAAQGIAARGVTP